MRTTILTMVVMALTVVPGAAATPDGCVDGLAREAGLDRPHVVDPVGDQYEGGGTVASTLDRDANDLRRFWVGVTPDSPVDAPVFTANFETDLTTHPVGLILVFRAEDRSYSWARALPDGGWAFETGHLSATAPLYAGHIFQPIAATTGSVDTAAGVVSITLLPMVHPQPHPDTDVVMPPYLVWAGYSASLITTGDMTLAPVHMTISDTAANADRCTIWLSQREDEVIENN